jgi:membrane-associated phospholipid phosphatase
MVAVRPLALALAAAVVAPAARAAEPPPPVPLEYNLAVDASVAGAAIAAGLVLGGLQSSLAPATCRWCKPGSWDGSVHDALTWSNPQAADITSTVVGNVAMPLSAIAYLVLSARAAGDTSAGWVDSLLLAEAVGLSFLLNQGVKYLAARQRPYAFYGDPVDKPESEKNLSFYSGHTSFAFATAAAVTTLSALRNYPGTAIIGACSFAAAAFVGYLRIAADMHYLTDVLVGAAIGGLVGFAVPFLFHPRQEAAATTTGSIRPALGGFAIAF